MPLSSLFNDFPVSRYDNGSPRRQRPVTPLWHTVLDSLEDQIEQKVGQVFRVLPHLTLNYDDMYENTGVSKKRKLRSGAVANYEPKSKVVVSDNDNKFKITLDTSNYQPEEITVKVVDNKLAISAKHQAKEKDVYEFCEMYRSFDLPDNVDPNAITSHLSLSGQLTVEAPLKSLSESKERTIPIEIEGKEQEVAKASDTTLAKENPENTTPTKENSENATPTKENPENGTPTEENSENATPTKENSENATPTKENSE